MPRDVSNVTVIGVYHPPLANNYEMKDHLNAQIYHIKTKYPNSWFFIAGDFNSFSDRFVTNSQYKRKENFRQVLYKLHKILSQI